MDKNVQVGCSGSVVAVRTDGKSKIVTVVVDFNPIQNSSMKRIL